MFQYILWIGMMIALMAVPVSNAKSEETEASEMFQLYQELVESAQFDWEWVIEPGEYEDFTFLGGMRIAVKRENGKYSVMDENGDLVFAEEYDFILPYNENMACAKNGGTFFYLDKDGNKVIQGTFQSARSFYEQKAAVQMSGRWGFIDADGKVVIGCQYEEVHDFQESCAAVKNENGWGFIDSNGKVIVPCQYDKVKDYSEGFAAVEKDGKWGYIDRMGHAVIELMYDDAGSFSEGKAPVERDDYYQSGLKAWAYINPENTVVIDWFPCYGGAAFREYVGEFHDGLAFVLREIPTIINENGEEVFESYFFISDYVYDSKYKAIPAYVFTDEHMTERKYGLVGLDGNCLIEPVFDWVSEPYGDYVRVEMIVEGKRCEGAIRMD
ncbi:MAG: WG repeat-containing protein [Clostridium sp.]|nr:WG repeat-containing protein [Clostridium sp.]